MIEKRTASFRVADLLEAIAAMAFGRVAILGVHKIKIGGDSP